MADLNPYAAPAAAGGYDGRDREEVGVWADGNLLVVHLQAKLPPICLETGQPAARWRKFDVLWSYPIDWSLRRQRLWLPLGEAPFRRYRRWWWIGCLSLVTPLLAGLQIALIWRKAGPPAEAMGGLFVLVLISAALCLTSSWLIGRPLRFVRVKGSHLWLKGASPAFLQQLPPWIRTQ